MCWYWILHNTHGTSLDTGHVNVIVTHFHPNWLSYQLSRWVVADCMYLGSTCAKALSISLLVIDMAAAAPMHPHTMSATFALPISSGSRWSLNHHSIGRYYRWPRGTNQHFSSKVLLLCVWLSCCCRLMEMIWADLMATFLIFLIKEPENKSAAHCSAPVRFESDLPLRKNNLRQHFPFPNQS